MLDATRAERGEKEIDNFIANQARRKGADEANLEAQRQREIDLKRLAAMRSENRAAWITHLRASARAHLHIARDARRRARELERGDDGEK